MYSISKEEYNKASEINGFLISLTAFVEIWNIILLIKGLIY